MPLIRAHHDVFGVCEVPGSYLDREEWTEVDPSTPTAREERRTAVNTRTAAAGLYDPAEHRLEPTDGDPGVLAYLRDATPEERARVIAAEAARGEHARTTVLNWQPLTEDADAPPAPPTA